MLGVTQAASPTPRCACRELDLRILQEALAKEAAQEEAEAAARAKRAEDVRLYRQQLANMMVKDMEDQGERDAMIQVGIGRPAPFSLKKTSVLAERILRQACTSPKCMHHDDSDGRREPWRAGRHDPGGRGQASTFFLPYTKKRPTPFPAPLCARILGQACAPQCARALVHAFACANSCVCVPLCAHPCAYVLVCMCPSMCLHASVFLQVLASLDTTPEYQSVCVCGTRTGCTQDAHRMCVWHAHGMHTGYTRSMRTQDAHTR